MLTVNGHTYDIDANACLDAYFNQKIGWHPIMAGPEYTTEERQTFFGPDCNRRNMREVRKSLEWVGIVTQFANEHDLDVTEAINKAVFTPRGPGRSVHKPAPPEPQEIRNEEVHKICTDAAKAESDANEACSTLAEQVETLENSVSVLIGTVTVLSGRILELEAVIQALTTGTVKHTVTLELPDETE